MNFPILSAIIFIPLIGAFFIFVIRGTEKIVEKNSKYVAIFSSIANLLLALFLWYSFDNSSPDFQFVEEKTWIKGLIIHNGMDLDTPVTPQQQPQQQPQQPHQHQQQQP